jgi:hypothetical protein
MSTPVTRASPFNPRQKGRRQDISCTRRNWGRAVIWGIAEAQENFFCPSYNVTPSLNVLALKSTNLDVLIIYHNYNLIFLAAPAASGVGMEVLNHYSGDHSRQSLPARRQSLIILSIFNDVITLRKGSGCS